jgi:hypothetical protein
MTPETTIYKTRIFTFSDSIEYTHLNRGIVTPLIDVVEIDQSDSGESSGRSDNGRKVSLDYGIL